MGFRIDGKTSIHLFTKNMNKELFVSIIEKHFGEMETMAEKNFELIWDNNQKTYK